MKTSSLPPRGSCAGTAPEDKGPADINAWLRETRNRLALAASVEVPEGFMNPDLRAIRGAVAALEAPEDGAIDEDPVLRRLDAQAYHLGGHYGAYRNLLRQAVRTLAQAPAATGWRESDRRPFIALVFGLSGVLDSRIPMDYAAAAAEGESEIAAAYYPPKDDPGDEQRRHTLESFSSNYWLHLLELSTDIGMRQQALAGALSIADEEARISGCESALGELKPLLAGVERASEALRRKARQILVQRIDGARSELASLVADLGEVAGSTRLPEAAEAISLALDLPEPGRAMLDLDAINRWLEVIESSCEALSGWRDEARVLEARRESGPPPLWSAEARDWLAEMQSGHDRVLEGVEALAMELRAIESASIHAPLTTTPDTPDALSEQAGDHGVEEVDPAIAEAEAKAERHQRRHQDMIRRMREKNGEMRRLRRQNQRLQKSVEAMREGAPTEAKANGESADDGEPRAEHWRSAMRFVLPRIATTLDVLEILSALYGEDRLVISEKAWKSAREHGRNKRAGKAFEVLESLAGPVLSELRDGVPLSVAANEHLPSTYAPADSDSSLQHPRRRRYREAEFNGATYSMEKHVDIGGHGRAYFEVIEGAAGPRILLGHCGAHPPTATQDT